MSVVTSWLPCDTGLRVRLPQRVLIEIDPANLEPDVHLSTSFAETKPLDAVKRLFVLQPQVLAGSFHAVLHEKGQSVLRRIRKQGLGRASP